jgi:hypothetical protein
MNIVDHTSAARQGRVAAAVLAAYLREVRGS